MTANRTITVYGAYGHTGRFVVAELRRRGWSPVLAGRDPGKLQALADHHGDLEVRPADIDSSEELDRAVEGAAAVINCAGPFLLTAVPVIEAALRAGLPYLDVAAELEAVADTFAHFDDRARQAGVVIVPAMAFYGGLGDLLASAALREWSAADEITIAYGLDSWHPTRGTRASGEVSRQRRQQRRVVYTGGEMQYRTETPPVVEWDFPAPLGTQKVVAEFTMADSVTIPRHVATSEIRSYMSQVAVADLSDPGTAAPVAADESGRSAQTFLVEVVARASDQERRAMASGRDIYAISAPLVAEATERVLAGQVTGIGALTAGQAFDAPDFLRSLPVTDLTFG
jgi:saccharopine dehydrogenase-like NADP-dependent oxidoreductase